MVNYTSVIATIAVLLFVGTVYDFTVGPHWPLGNEGKNLMPPEVNHTGEAWMGDDLGWMSQKAADALNASKTASDNGSDDTSLVYSVTDFKDWVNGKLDINTEVNDIEVFSNVDEAQSIVDDVWNPHHDRKWNIDNSAIEIANKFGDDDPAKSIFYSDNDMFVVTKKTSGIGPQVWSPDKDGKLVKETPKNKKVYATDKLAKEA